MAYLARNIAGYTVRKIADLFRRSSVTVTEAITKVENPLRKDKTIAEELKLLAENLIKGRKRKYRMTQAYPSNAIIIQLSQPSPPLSESLPFFLDKLFEVLYPQKTSISSEM